MQPYHPVYNPNIEAAVLSTPDLNILNLFVRQFSAAIGRSLASEEIDCGKTLGCSDHYYIRIRIGDVGEGDLPKFRQRMAWFRANNSPIFTESNFDRLSKKELGAIEDRLEYQRRLSGNIVFDM